MAYTHEDFLLDLGYVSKEGFFVRMHSMVFDRILAYIESLEQK